MEITWEVEDGYAGGKRPHYTEIPEEELLDCGTVDEAIVLIEEYIFEDYDATIGWYYDNYTSLINDLQELLSDNEED